MGFIKNAKDVKSSNKATKTTSTDGLYKPIEEFKSNVASPAEIHKNTVKHHKERVQRLMSELAY